MPFTIGNLRFKNVDALNKQLTNAAVEFSLFRGRKISLKDDTGQQQIVTVNKIFEEIKLVLETTEFQETDKGSLKEVYSTCESLKNKGYEKENPSWQRAPLFTRLITLLKHFISNKFRSKLPEIERLRFSSLKGADNQYKSNNTTDIHQPMDTLIAAQGDQKPALHQQKPGDVAKDNRKQAEQQTKDPAPSEPNRKAEQPVKPIDLEPLDTDLVAHAKPDELASATLNCNFIFEQLPADLERTLAFMNLSPLMIELVVGRANCPESFMLKQIEKNSSLVKHCFLKSNPEFIRKAIQINPAAYEFLEPISKEDDEIKKLVLKHPQCSKQTTIQVLSSKGILLSEAKEEFQRDRDVCLAAFRQNPEVWSQIEIELELSSEDIQLALKKSYCPKDFAHDQITKNGMLIQYCHLDYLNKDKELAEKAVRQNWLAFKSLVDSGAVWSNDADFIDLVIQIDPHAYEYVREKMNIATDYKLEKKVLSHDSCSEELAIQILSKNGELLQNANNSLKNSPAVCRAAFTSKINGWDYIPRAMQEQLNLTQEEMSEVLRNENCKSEVALFLLRKDGMLLKESHPNILNTFNLVAAAVSQNGLALQFCKAFDMPNYDLEIALKAIENNPDAYRYVNEKLKKNKEIMRATVEHPNCSGEIKVETVNNYLKS